MNLKRLRYILLVLVFVASPSAMLQAAESTRLERILAMPFTPSGPARPLEGFEAYGGSWTLNDGVLLCKGDSGSRLTYDAQEWANATRGAIEVDLRFNAATPGYSGICFKISGSGIGADAFNGYELGFNPAEKHVNVGAHRQNYTAITRVPYDVPVGEYFTLRVEFDETGFAFYLDGVYKGEYHEAELKATDPLRAGTFTFRSWQNDVEYRDLRVRLDATTDGFVDAPFTAVDLVKPEEESSDYPETLATDDLPPFIYVARAMRGRPNSVGNDFWQATPQTPGCAIRMVDPADPTAEVKTIFEDPDGSIYDMNLSYDAKTVYFSYRPKNNSYWNIWSVGVDGKGLRQLTNGPFFDVSPAELPDGGIVFVSSRRFGRTVCQPGPASNLFRMDKNGDDIQCVSMNTLSDFNPQVLADGRVIFTRWEYVDRDLTYRQSLWTQNPEGTLYQLYYGNTLRDFGSILQARPIPGAPSSRVLATFTPHHGYPHGAIGVVDRAMGVEAGADKGGYKYWTKEFPTVVDVSRDYAYRDPFPLDEERALCAYGGATRIDENDAETQRYRIWLLDCDGEKRLLWEDPEFDAFCPIAVEETPRPPVLPTRIVEKDMKAKLRPELKPAEVFSGLRKTDGVEACNEYSKLAEYYNVSHESQCEIDGAAVAVGEWGIPERMDLLEGDPVGQVVLADVYQGLEPIVKRGEVKKLRIMEQIRKSEELYDRSFDQSPSMGVATYYAKRCWGEVPVDEDGSANFYVPALREIYFQALDAEGREIQRMTSAAQFMPGESIGCVGCHEDRDSIPATAQDESRRPTAALRSPDMPVLPDFIYDAYEYRQSHDGNLSLDAGVVDYPSLMQPVLDRYCVSCHDGADPTGGYDLSGDATRYFSASYESLLLKSRSYRQADMLTGEMPEDQQALGKPLVQFYWLLWTTSAVNMPYTTGALASRLPEYFTKEHCGQEVDDVSLRRVYFWLDSNAIYQGTYANARPLSAGRRDRWAPLDKAGLADWFSKELAPIYAEKCADCHKRLTGENRDRSEVFEGPNTDWIGRFGWIDLTRPEKSALLNAHLAKAAGGRGLSTDKNAPEDSPALVFESKDDAQWQALYNAILKGKALADKRPEADRPGFRNARTEP